jgi:3-phosphoshikimate 1-carboxyvinyltransferase
MTDISDTVQSLAAVALFVSGPTTIRGVPHIRHKESDRISDLARELRRAGAGVNEFPDGLQIYPGLLQPTDFQTYDDHRMAMSLALIGLKQPGVRITQPECVAKTYPNYFSDVQRVTMGN